MNYEQKFRIVIIVAILFILNLFGWFNKELDKKDELWRKDVNYIASVVSEYREKEKQYRNTIINIVENTYRVDSHLNVGGSSEEIRFDYDKVSEYEKILTSTSSFDDVLKNLENFFDNRSDYFDSIPNIFPINFSNYVRITSPWGERLDPFTYDKVVFHSGIDITSVWHDDIIATADGYVEDNWIFHPIYGKWVHIVHENGFETYYAHMAEVYVHEGDYVKKGQVIGILGKTGKVRGGHVHYEVWKDGECVDPINYLKGYYGDN